LDANLTCFHRHVIGNFRPQCKVSKSYFFFAGFISLIFSLTYVQTCSDYQSYQEIYNESNDTFTFLNFLQVDRLFYNLSSLYQSVIDYTKYDLFVALYQTASLIILFYSIYHLCHKWKNTILFLNLFGSLQFYHLSVCTLRQGLSSALTVLLCTLLFNQSIERSTLLHSKNKYIFYSFNAISIFIGFLSINAHWTGIIVSATIYGIKYFQDIRLSEKIIIIRKVIYIVTIFLTVLIFTLPAIIMKLNIYLSESISGYGSNIYLTVISDLVLICIAYSDNFKKFKRADHSSVSICWLTLLCSSILLVCLKMLTFLGFGFGIRIILGLTTLQLICLPVLLEKLNLLLRLFVVFLIATPYLIFIFVFGTEKFVLVQSTLF
jgi:hypothetical protein